MLNIINGRNYLVKSFFMWGSERKDVISTLDDDVNLANLEDDMIESLDIYSSLAYPFFRGSLVYLDKRNSSEFRNLIDIPIVYGRVLFCIISGNDVPGSDNVAEPEEGETFSEDIFVTQINTIDDGKSDFVKVKVDFVSSDYLKFISNMTNVSTFDGFDTNKKPVKDVLKEMFSEVGLADRLDEDSITINVDIPYVSSENDTLLTALDYVYRKIFDFDFKENNGKTYCRIVYDFTKQKYVLWKFNDVGTADALDTKIENVDIKDLRENMSVSSKIGSDRLGIDSAAYIKSSGNQSVLFEMMDDLKFIDYDYLENKFTKTVKTDNGLSFVEHDDECVFDLINKSELVLGNCKLFKDNRYERTFSTSRQNASFYDVFTESIFETSFIRAESFGSIGRRAGNQIYLSFNNCVGTIYEQITGDYLITAIHNHYEKSGEKGTFRSIMDLYRPYCASDMYKTDMLI